jgi:hypothetical protein
MASFTPPQAAHDQQTRRMVIPEAVRDGRPEVRQDIALPTIPLAPKTLMLDFAPSPNQYKAAAKKHAGAKGRQTRSSLSPRRVLSLSLQCETVQAQDPEMD